MSITRNVKVSDRNHGRLMELVGEKSIIHAKQGKPQATANEIISMLLDEHDEKKKKK